jgi:hypothetical protein
MLTPNTVTQKMLFDAALHAAAPTQSSSIATAPQTVPRWREQIWFLGAFAIAQKTFERVLTLSKLEPEFSPG